MPNSGLSQVQDHPIHVAHNRARRLRIGNSLFFAGCILIICFIALPLLYGSVPTSAPIDAMLRPPQLGHILLNCTANALVMLRALIGPGDRLDRKLASVLTDALLVHGSLAFLILLTRQPYSNMIMPLAVLVSIFGGILIMYVQHRAVRPRIAVLGVQDEVVERSLIGDYDYVDDPHSDLRVYDILLTASVFDLSPEWSGAISRAMLAGKRIRHLAEFSEERQGLVAIDHFDLEHLPAGSLASYRTRKRLLDIGLILVTAPITVPLILLAMAVVLVTMGRPVMFIQERAGLGGKPFRMYKLRTMRPLSLDDAARTTTVGDDRVTPVGRLFRRYRIDELPQLWNVLRGQMSVIGPRPEWTVLSEQYTAELPVYAYRHLVRPGITGWAQVRGGYAGDLAETRTKVGHDLFYIKHVSFSMDVQILIRTVWTLLSGSGAR